MHSGAEQGGCECDKVYGDSMGISSYIFTYIQCSMVGLWPIYEAKGQVEAQHLPDPVGMREKRPNHIKTTPSILWVRLVQTLCQKFRDQPQKLSRCS